MKPLTKEQRTAIKRVYDRQSLVVICRAGQLFPSRAENYPPGLPQLTYLQFRRFARQGYGCIMLPWCGMWLGIEPDGYTHS